MNEAPDVIGTKEAASLLGVSVRTVQLWVEKGALQAWKTSGGHRRILRSSVEAALQSRDGSPPAQSESRLKILIVEDEPTVQSYYAALFEILQPDAHITMVDDGYEALIELGKSQPDLLLVDVDLPQMDGVTLIRKALKSDSVRGTQISVITGLSKEQLAERGELPPDIPVFGKPISIDRLKSLLSTFAQTKEREQ